MMSIRSNRDVVDAELQGRSRTSEFVKNVTQTTPQGIWFDLTGSSGNPRAKQWFDSTPLVARQIKQSTDGGIYHGADVAGDGYAKYLRQLRVGCASATPLPMHLILCDYLLYYPTVEDGNTSPQVMDNTVTLPRYEDGLGVQMMPITISGRTGGQAFYANYTNSDGVAGRQTVFALQSPTSIIPGSVVTNYLSSNSGAGAFFGLQDGDKGVRSVQSVTMNGPDTGFFAVVLVKPLTSIAIRGIDAVYEKDLLLFGNEMPRIYDDAYLSLLACPNGSMSGVAVRGNIKTIWG